MAAREKTRDELDMKTLRELATLPCNKYCFDCGQRGPTYVNVTIGAFVCSSCGGLLRGLNPPHRVKSLTVCSFTEVEMDRIKSRGNEYCTHIWLGKYDAKSGEADHSSPDKMREFMRLKYEEKKYYVDPREAIKKMKPRAPAVPSSAASVTQSKSHIVIQNKDSSLLQKSGALSQTFSDGDVLNNTASDLFKDFESDPFRDVKPVGGDSKTDGASFADFSSAFGNNTDSKAASSSSGQTQNSPIVSSSSATVSGIHISTSHKKPAPPPPDRYAALADLDNQLHQQVVTSEMPTSVPSAINTSTSSAVFWSATGMPASAVFTPVPPNPFSGSPWPQQTISTPNPFQGVPQPIPTGGIIKSTVSQQTPTTLPSAKPSLPNGNVNSAFWAPSAVSSQPWANQFQNGQSDAFQSKAPVVDSCNPWSQSFGVTGANPFMNGSFGAGQSATSATRTNAGKNPFL